MPSAQQKQGDAIHEAIRENLVIDKEGWAHDLVHRAAERLQVGVAAEERLEPVVVWIEEATAFTLPGRYIYLSRRLLQLGLSEEATAFVIAHEMGHHRLGHLREWLTEIPGAWLAGVLAKMAHRALVSPENEAAADRWALERCVAAGYDRERCLTLFDALSRAALDAGDVDGVFGHEDPEDLARERLRELDGEAPKAKEQLAAFLATARRWTWQRQRGYASLSERRAALKDVALTKDVARKAPGDHRTIDLLEKWEAYLASRGARRTSA